MKSFFEWIKLREMCGGMVGTSVAGSDPKVKHVDFQVWGDPASAINPKRKYKHKKHKKK